MHRDGSDPRSGSWDSPPTWTSLRLIMWSKANQNDNPGVANLHGHSQRPKKLLAGREWSFIVSFWEPSIVVGPIIHVFMGAEFWPNYLGWILLVVRSFTDVITTGWFTTTRTWLIRFCQCKIWFDQNNTTSNPDRPSSPISDTWGNGDIPSAKELRILHQPIHGWDPLLESIACQKIRFKIAKATIADSQKYCFADHIIMVQADIGTGFAIADYVEVLSMSCAKPEREWS